MEQVFPFPIALRTAERTHVTTQVNPNQPDVVSHKPTLLVGHGGGTNITRQTARAVPLIRQPVTTLTIYVLRQLVGAVTIGFIPSDVRLTIGSAITIFRILAHS